MEDWSIGVMEKAYPGICGHHSDLLTPPEFVDARSI
jgi:hypothetical protein